MQPLRCGYSQSRPCRRVSTRRLVVPAKLAALTALALPPALAAMSRADRIQETQLSSALLGQFTPAAGDPRLIARYAKVSERARQSFSFTPVLADRDSGNRAITVVVRSRDDSTMVGVDTARTRALIASPEQQVVTIAPVAYNLGASVGFEKFVMPSVGRGIDIRNLPVARTLDPRPAKPPRFASRVSSVVDRNGRSMEHAYDDAGRLTKEVWKSNAGVTLQGDKRDGVHGYANAELRHSLGETVTLTLGYAGQVGTANRHEGRVGIRFGF